LPKKKSSKTIKMKQRFLQLIVGSVITASCLLTTELQAQNTFPANGSVGIGTTAPNTSSILELNSVTKGFLAPRMTKAQRDAIVNPAVGLMIYQTNNSAGYYFWNGTSWLSMRQSVVSKNLGNLTAPTAINTSLLPNTTGVIDLGEPNFAWRDLYLSGSIYKNGTSRGLATPEQTISGQANKPDPVKTVHMQIQGLENLRLEVYSQEASIQLWVLSRCW
jgi:hypothetical protein